MDNKNTFEDFLKTATYSRPTDGKHQIVIKKVNHTKDTQYITLTTELDGKREFNFNMFQRDISFAISAIRQHNIEQTEGATPLEIFQFAITEQLVLDIWIQSPIVATAKGMRQVMNIYWREPAPEEDSNTVDAEDIIEA